MTEMHNPMSPSLAGIVSDPNDSGRRIVPASQRADGSVRKERKVRPGHVPAEDVAKYRPGQGSLRAQHVAAQATHQAPPSPSPAPATSTIRRPNPADFLTEVKLREQQQAAAAAASSSSSSSNGTIPAPPASPTKASAAKSSGASSSRWAVAAPAVEAAPAAPTPAPALAPAAATTTTASNRGKPRTRGGARQGKARALHPEVDSSQSSTIATEGEATPEATPTPVVQEQAKENVAEKVAEAEVPPPASIPSTPDSKSSIPDLPETPGGDWWADEDDDEDVDAAAQALQGISIKDTAQRQKQGSPTPTPPTTTNKPLSIQHYHQQHQQERKAPPGRNSNGQQHNTPRETNNKTPAKKAQPTNNKATTATNKAGSVDLLSRLGPPVPAPAAAPTEAEKTPTAKALSTSFSSKMTIEEVRTRARTINQEIRQLNQLKKYAEAGAVLSKEQKTDINGSAPLLQELSELKSMADNLASEVTQLFEAANR